MNLKNKVKIKTPYIYKNLKKASTSKVYTIEKKSILFQTTNYEKELLHKRISYLL